MYPEQANLRLLWRTDYAPGKLNSVPLTVASGRLLPATLARDPNWIGRIRGIALLVQGPLSSPFRVRGVAAKPLGAFEIAGDRAARMGQVRGIHRNVDRRRDRRRRRPGTAPAGAARSGRARRARASRSALRARAGASLPACPPGDDIRGRMDRAGRGWFVISAGKLERQRCATRATTRANDISPPKTDRCSPSSKRCAPGFPPLPRECSWSPTRTIFAAAAPITSIRTTCTSNSTQCDARDYRMRSGDYLVVYQRRGVQYDPETERLRWNGSAPIAAELIVREPGAALFRIR